MYSKVNGKISVLSVCLISLASCGGGGSSGGNSTNGDVTGRYSGQIFEVQNNCRSVLPTDDTASVSWLVNQSGTRVVLDASSGATYEGEVLSGNSFQVSRTNFSAQCAITTTIAFENIESESAAVDSRVSGDCGNFSCLISYAGTLNRVK
jgi:hypothetical protein